MFEIVITQIWNKTEVIKCVEKKLKATHAREKDSSKLSPFSCICYTNLECSLLILRAFIKVWICTFHKEYKNSKRVKLLYFEVSMHFCIRMFCIYVGKQFAHLFLFLWKMPLRFQIQVALVFGKPSL